MTDALAHILARPGELLTTHTVNVAAQIGQLAGLRALPQYPRLWGRLRWAAYLHDSGKLARGFQRGLRSRKHRWGLRHEILSLAFVDWAALEAEDRLPVIAAVATHHRSASWLLDTYRPASERVEHLVADLDTAAVDAWYDWLRSQGLTLQPLRAPSVAAIYAALAELDVWLAALESGGSTHPDFAETVLLRGFMFQADHRAAAAAPDLTAAVLDQTRLESVLCDKPYRHQRAAKAYRRQSAVLVAPTGSGKTEAALLWAGEGPRLFYVLPYRASMNAMKARLEQFTPQVGLQHGRALAALYFQLLDAHDPHDALGQARAALHLSRLMGQPVRVFSPYHLLRIAYQMKGFEALLADCQDAALIVDEIHAYAPERLALILGLLALLRARFGLHVLIMTATLPPVVAAAITETLGDLPVIRADEDTFRKFTRHRVFVRPGELFDALPEIATAAPQQATLVIVNTVRRARAAAAALRALGCPVLLLHGRFNARDRAAHESELFRRFGTHRQPPPYPVVVATQVIEVSLDISLDRLYSDPAPLDALLQRFGRINRLRQGDLCPVTVFEQPTGADDRFAIYDPGLVMRSVALLRAHQGEPVDEHAVGTWLAEVYADAADWQARWHKALTAFTAYVLKPLHAFEAADASLTALFQALVDECTVLPLALEAEYRALAQTRPVEADALTVSLAWRQYKMLEKRGLAWPAAEEHLFLTAAAYTAETGLALEDDDEA